MNLFKFSLLQSKSYHKQCTYLLDPSTVSFELSTVQSNVSGSCRFDNTEFPSVLLNYFYVLKSRSLSVDLKLKRSAPKYGEQGGEILAEILKSVFSSMRLLVSTWNKIDSYRNQYV